MASSEKTTQNFQKILQVDIHKHSTTLKRKAVLYCFHHFKINFIEQFQYVPDRKLSFSYPASDFAVYSTSDQYAGISHGTFHSVLS